MGYGGSRFRVLGPLEVVGTEGPVALGPPKQRRVLAVLLSRIGEPVSVDALTEAVWGQRPPRSAHKTLQGYVVHLRQAMAGIADGGRDGTIQTVPGGYRLNAPAEAVDAFRFTALVTRSRQAVAVGNVAAARVFVTEALALWRGPAYVEFADSEFAAVEVSRLEELRLAAIETGLECELTLGEDATLVAVLEKELAQRPTRERLWELLIRALYLSGRQSDALSAYVRARGVLRSEVGVDPGPALRAVHAAVLAQDPSLERRWAPPAELTAPQPRSGVYTFDGREEELAWLRGLWLATHESGGRSAVVHGPSGIGKTRLLAAFADEVQRSQTVVVRRTGLTAPNLTTVAGLAGGNPALVVLDDPLTGVDVKALTELPILVVAGFDPETASGHVTAGFAPAEWRELTALSDDVCARIARRWLGEDDDDLKPILEAAKGNPGRLHQLLAHAVQQRSRRQIATSVAGSQAARSELDAARSDLAKGVRGLRRGRALAGAMPGTTRVGAGGSAGTGGACPYLGLDAYQPADAELFHGRDTVVEQLVARVADTPLIAVVGASGSGKSSLVRAGLLASLSAGCLPDSASWPQFVVTPDHPLPTVTSTPSVVVIDQFEQALMAGDDTARRDYLDAVVSLADSGCRVILTLRADHVDRCSTHARLRDLVADGTVLLGPLNAAELTEVIVGPATLVGFEVEPALVERVLDDVRGLTAPLPLVSTALAETWRHAVSGSLTREGYLDCGGVAGALARRAEAAHDALTSTQQAAARRLLLRLATGEPGTLVARRCPQAEAVTDEPSRAALDALAAARLVTVDSTGVEVAHESLFDNWPRLSDWLADDEQARRLRAHLAPTAADWHRSGRPEPDLYRGVRLDAAVATFGDQIGDPHGDLTPIERDFLAASIARAEQELQSQRARAVQEARARRRLGGLLAAVAVAAVLAVVASIIAVVQRNTAGDNARLAVARQVGAVALTDQPLDRSLLLAVSAVRIDDNVGTRTALLTALQRAPAATGMWRGDGSSLHQLTLSNGDRTAVAADLTGVSVWDLAKGRTPSMTGLFRNQFTPLLAARPGTDQVAVANDWGLAAYAPAIGLWDPVTRDRVNLHPGDPGVQVTSMSWTADGRYLAAAQEIGDVLVWDVEQPRQPPRHISRYRPAGVHDPAGCACTPRRFPAVVHVGGSNVAVIEHTGDVQISAPSSTVPLRTFSVGQDATSVSANRQGSVLAVGRTTGTVSLFSLADGRALRSVPGHSGVVEAVEFSPTGEVLASVGDDNAAIVTDVATGRLIARLTGHTESVTAAAFTRDGRTLYTASVDGTIIGWDLVNLNVLGEQLGPPSTGPGIESLATGPTGNIAIGYSDGTARILGAEGSNPVRVTVSAKSLIGMALSPDGRFAATSDLDGVARILNATTGQVIATIELPAPAYAVAFSPDGRRLVLVDSLRGFSSVHVVEVPSWRRIGEPWAAPVEAFGVAWSPDSRLVALTGRSQSVAVDMESLSLRWKVPGERDASSAVAWSPDRSIVASGGGTARGIQLLSASDGARIGGGWRDHTWLTTLAFSPNGSLLASAGWDGTVVLRDVASGQRFGPQLMTSPARKPAMAAFDAQGRLVVASNDGGLWRWDVGLPHLLRAACAIAGRDLEPEEWSALNTGLPKVEACP